MASKSKQRQQGIDALRTDEIEKARHTFQQTPWCAELLQDPSLTIHQPMARDFKTYENNYDSFMSRTLATSDTIRASLTIRARSYNSAEFPRIRECITLFDLGENLSGHQLIAHGGVVATLLDEGLGLLLSMNDDVEQRENPQHRFKTLMTLYLNITYRKGVPTPGIILCRAQFVKTDGRKNFIRGTLEDGTGVVLAEAESLFLELKQKADARGEAKI